MQEIKVICSQHWHKRTYIYYTTQQRLKPFRNILSKALPSTYHAVRSPLDCFENHFCQNSILCAFRYYYLKQVVRKCTHWNCQNHKTLTFFFVNRSSFRHLIIQHPKQTIVHIQSSLSQSTLEWLFLHPKRTWLQLRSYSSMTHSSRPSTWRNRPNYPFSFDFWNAPHLQCCSEFVIHTYQLYNLRVLRIVL